jgi:crotonobetainyl-CoA:carnitine CoA-transferase CaiB-like acyl-CoA transferase
MDSWETERLYLRRFENADRDVYCEWLPAPILGRHTHMVLRDLLRLSAVEIAQLEARGVLDEMR